jgi:hypothetical protein
MKKAFLAFGKLARLAGAAVMIAFVSVSVTSCSKEGCTDVNANNYDEKADEDDGSCTFDRDPMIGNYVVSGTIQCGVTQGGAESDIPVTISASTVATNKIIINVDGLAFTAVVSGTSFTLESQSLDGFDYTGSGSVIGNNINLVLNEFDASIPETCVFTLNGSRQ